MSIESQLERICVALEALATIHAGPVFNKEQSLQQGTTTSVEEVSSKKIGPKTETKKAEPKAEPEPDLPEAKPAEQTGDTALAVSRDDLAVKVRALAAIDRPAAAALIKSFGVERLDKLDPSQYIAFDLAIAKALVKAKAGQEG